MLDSAIVLQAIQFNNYLNGGCLLVLRGNTSLTGQPTADVFETQDGYLQITALRQAQVEKLFSALDITEMLTQPAFSTPKTRLQHQKIVAAAITTVLKTRTTVYWLRKLAALEVPVAEVLADPQLAYRHLLTEFPLPPDNEQTVKIVQAAFSTNADGPKLRTPTHIRPTYGRDTDHTRLFGTGDCPAI